MIGFNNSGSSENPRYSSRRLPSQTENLYQSAQPFKQQQQTQQQQQQPNQTPKETTIIPKDNDPAQQDILKKKIATLEAQLKESETKHQQALADLTQQQQKNHKESSQSIDQMKSDVEKYKKLKEDAEAALAKKSKELQDQQTKNEHLHFYLQRNAHQFQLAEDQLRKELEFKHEQINGLQRQSQLLTPSRTLEKNDNERMLKQEIQELGQRLTNQDIAAGNKQKELQQIILNLQEQIKAKQQECDQLAMKNNKNTHTDAAVEELKLKNEQLLNQKEAEIESLKKQLAEKIKTVEEKTKEIEALRSTDGAVIAQLKQQNEVLRAQVDELGMQIDQQQKKRTANRSANNSMSQFDFQSQQQLLDKINFMEAKNKCLTSVIVELESKLARHGESPSKQLGLSSNVPNDVYQSSNKKDNSGLKSYSNNGGDLISGNPGFVQSSVFNTNNNSNNQNQVEIARGGGLGGGVQTQTARSQQQPFQMSNKDNNNSNNNISNSFTNNTNGLDGQQLFSTDKQLNQNQLNRSSNNFLPVPQPYRPTNSSSTGYQPYQYNVSQISSK